MKKELSKKQEKVLKEIKKYIAKNNYPPTVRELCKILNLNSTSTIHFHLNTLIDKGYLKRKDGGSRTLEVVGKNEYLEDNSETISIPLLGEAHCGNLTEAIHNYDEELYVPSALINKKKDVFAIKTIGDSMINAGIFDDDYLIIEVNKNPNNGDIVLAMDENDDLTVKRFYKKKDHILLKAENDLYDDIKLQNVNILGIVIALYRTF